MHNQMRERTQKFDWSQTELGPMNLWPKSLKSLCEMMLGSQLPMYITWGQNRIFLYNDAYIPLLGELKHKAALGQPFHSVWPEVWKDVEPMMLAADSGASVLFEDMPLTLERKGYRETGYFTFSFSALVDDEGTQRGLLCTCIETTKRIEAETSLRKSEERLALAVSASDVGIWDLDLKTNRVAWSDSVVRLWGYGESEFQGRLDQFWDRIHPDDILLVRERFEFAIQNRELYEAEFRICPNRSELRWVYAKGRVYDDAETPTRMSGTVIDISQRKFAEERLSRLNRELLTERILFNEVLKQLPVAVGIGLPGTGELVLTNRALSEIWRLPVRPVAENEYDQLFEGYFENGTRVENDQWPLSRALRGETVTNQIIRIIRADGTIGFTRQSAAPVYDDNKRLLAGVVTFSDITEERAAQDRIQSLLKAEAEARSAAESANNLKSVFLANMSHEIRTPLGIILGTLDLMRECRDDAHEFERLYRMTERNAQQLNKLINEVLDLSKIEAGVIQVEETRFSLHELLQDLAMSLDVKAKEKGIQLRLHSDGPVCEHILSDPLRLRQILTNVIGNAIKFTDDGSVDVTLRTDFPANENERAHFEIIVSDTGIGLSKEHRGRIFQPFAQADSSVTRRFGGTGLGLALSRRLAQALGGDIEVLESERGKGCTFKVWVRDGYISDTRYERLPLQTLEAEHAVVSHHRDPAPLTGVRILLVDDSADNRFLVSRFLQTAGAEVEMAEDGEQGVRLAREGNHSAILMDIQMPKMDGETATQILRSQGYRRPIFALTAHAMSHDRERGLRLGFDEYFTKPVNRSELIRRLADLR